MFVNNHFGTCLLGLLLPALGCDNSGGAGSSDACTPWAWEGSASDGSTRTLVGGLGAVCNDPRCPATFLASRPLCYSDGAMPGGQCSMIGFECWYQGAGDNGGNAVVACSGLWADGGSTGRWACAQ